MQHTQKFIIDNQDFAIFELINKHVNEILPQDDQQLKEYELFLIFLSSNIQRTFSPTPSDSLVAFSFEIIRKAQLYIRDRKSINDVDTADDISFKNDITLQTILEISQQIIGQLVKLGDEGVAQLLNLILLELSQYLQATQGKFLNLKEFAPISIVFKVIEYLIRDKRFAFTEAILKTLDQIQGVTYTIFEIYKQNSQYFIITIASSSKYDEERQVRRMSVIFTDILEMLVQFSCLYLKNLSKLGQAQIYIVHANKLYQTLFADTESQVQLQADGPSAVECFTLRERLKILSELNSIFNLIPEIINKKYYWRLIKDGLSDTDNYCRKVSMSVLKSNLQVIGNEQLYNGFINKEEFEQLWTTFFDVYDTLESFGSHLTKAVWGRTEVIYKYIKDKYQDGVQLHPLLDFREWILVVYRRIQTHPNLKVRRCIIKATLKRPYVTTHMNEYIFDIFVKSLNKGLIFKDTNVYTQFSQSNELVNKFYEQYFFNESVDVAGDLRAFFKGFIKHVTYPQLILCTLKIISREYKQNEGFIGNQELKEMYDVMNSYFAEQIFSSKYLCYKYIYQMTSQYLQKNTFKDINVSLLLKIIGKMPIQFFTNQTSYQDKEAHKASITFVDLFAVQWIQDGTITQYLKDLFEIKAIVSQMPKYGNEIDLIISGLAKVLLALGLRYQDQHYQWFIATIRPIFENLTHILNSSYLSPEVLDSKVRYLSILFRTIYNYSDNQFRHVLRQELLPLIPIVFDRLENNLIMPLTKYEQAQYQPTERQKIQSLFSELDNYLDFLQLTISMTHIHMNQSNSPVEKIIKQILQQTLKISSAKELASLSGWGPFLLQFVLFQCLKKITHQYTKGIRDSLRRGIQYFMVPDDIFVIGKPLLHNILEFKQLPKPKEDDSEEFNEGRKFMIDNDTSIGLMSQAVLINQWKTLSELVQIFQYESQIKQEILVLYPIIAEKAADFLSCTTPKYLTSLFRVLKLSYLPLLLQKVVQDEFQQEQNIIQYQQICYQMWGIIKELQTDFSVHNIQEFLEFTFNADLMELYQRVLSPALSEQVKQFHKKMAQEVFDQGNKYWLIFRSVFNHLMQIFSNRPHLIKGFEQFFMNFAICREIRSLDADINLYRLQNLIPQIFAKDYENLPMEEITYQGAYIRTITMIILEELLRSHKVHFLSGNPLNQNSIIFIESVEELALMLLDINFQAKYILADMPYSEKHRVKVRSWQTLIVLMEFFEPALYSPSFRQMRVQQSGRDIVALFNEKFWKIVGMNHLSSVRQFIEIVAIKFTKMYPELSIENPLFIKTLLDPNIKPQVASSFLVIAGYILTQPLNVVNEIQLKHKIFESLSGFLTSNSAHARCVAQYFIYELQANPNQSYRSFIPEGMKSLMNFLNLNKDVKKLMAKQRIEVDRIQTVVENLKGVHVVLSTQIDSQGEFLSVPFVEKMREVLSVGISEIRKQDFQPIDREDLWKKELEIRKENGTYQVNFNEESTQNYQRKILPWEQVEYDYELLKRVYDNRKRNEIIMCASLIDKVPNLAGLARTSEIMNAACLVINNKAVCELEDFKGVSVTSEKWLPIVEVQEKNLYQYLEYQKSNGYVILGIEQTANSKMLNEYKFPSKCILLLGKEKEGIPQQYLNILDQCIEIPQFGIIRSLNVHVSGALCLWEYTKQHIPKKLQ
ncbi:rrna methylase family [Stylonychia lemnae]|uniref:tRNA (guanosine(18)-2'-O)-methyltransferase TARBP1 n=1 Tax=Stylonychia lemnae TaxID=5949 RepID=A0A078AN77_STYLE|nr:rrna methylase family [Stylonychia lemnae]|eukprot:CDW83820.1 rrna methylase family [Stylonychia lemnae]